MTIRWFLLLALLPALASFGCKEDAPTGAYNGIVDGGGPNPNLSSPGHYTQSALSIPLPSVLADPTSFNDELYNLGAPWTLSSTATYMWSHRDLGLGAIYQNLTLPAQELVVAVIDTGVDKDHEDLEGRLWMNPGEKDDDKYNNRVDDDGDGYVDDYLGWNFNGDRNNPADDNGHGTHVSGTIAAIGNNTRGIVGVAPWVRIMALKVCNSNGSCASSDIRAGIDYAVAHGAKVINISLGGVDTGADSIAFDDAITEATRNGTLVVVASGNSAIDTSYMSPANATHAMAIAAHRSDGEICSFSDYGFKVDLSAPGCALNGDFEVSGILSLNSTKCGSSGATPCSSRTVGTKYTLKQGTSMATPHAVGMAAVAWTASPTATPLMIRQALLRTARPIVNGKKNIDFGNGTLSATNLISEAQTAPGLKITSPRYATSGDSFTIGMRVEARAYDVSWTLRYQAAPFANDVNFGSGTQIATGTVPAGTNFEPSQNWTPPAAGDYLVIVEAIANGQKYYDLTLVTRR